MRRLAALLTAAVMLLVCGCGDASGDVEPKMQGGDPVVEDMPDALGGIDAGMEEAGISKEEPAAADAIQGGPYGEISLSVPAGWSYECYPVDSEELRSAGMYGLHFFPEDVSQGYIELVYVDFFAVCGTGLKLEDAVIAGRDAHIGTYDNHEYWDYVSFAEKLSGVVAFTFFVEDWPGEYLDQALEILDTMTFDSDVREGGANIEDDASQLSEVGLSLSLKDISSTGATLVFCLYDAEAAKGELIYGDDFALEVLKDGQWESVSVATTGDYGFNAIAYMLVPEAGVEQGGNLIVERYLDWEWLYGKLKPGEYRIGKSVIDIVEGGDNNRYMIYAHFVLN